LGKHAFAIYFLLACAEQRGIVPVTARWLLEHMPAQTSPHTVTDALRYLCGPEQQLAIRVQKGWRLASNIVQFPLSYLITQGQEENRAEREYRAGRESVVDVVIDAQAKNPLSTITTITLTESKNRAERENLLERDFDAQQAACIEALRGYGVFGKKARELARLSWVNPEYIRSHIERARRESWNNPEGMAICRMLEQIDISENEPYENDYRRYAMGKYAAYVNRDDEDDDEEASAETEEGECDEGRPSR
jgi:hypothetical protein